MIRLGRLFGKKLPLSFGKELALEGDLLRGLKLEFAHKIHAQLQHELCSLFTPYKYDDFALLLKQLAIIERSRQAPEPQNIITKPAIDMATLERGNYSGRSDTEGYSEEQVRLAYLIACNEKSLGKLEQQAESLRQEARDPQRYQELKNQHTALLAQQQQLLEQAGDLPSFNDMLQQQQLLAYKIRNYLQLKYIDIAEHAMKHPPARKALKEANAKACFSKLQIVNHSLRQKKRLIDG